MSAEIKLSGVGKRFAQRGGEPMQVLDRLDLSVGEGEFRAVLGPSGCGKTTLLRLVDGLAHPDAGAVLVGGRPPAPGPRIGFVFQGFRLIPWASVAANVDFGLSGAGLAPAERVSRVARILETVGLSRFAEAYPGELSGGMKQRVALARGLVSEPDVLLMDEPFASLDAQSRELMQDELTDLWLRRRPTVLFVTHSVDEAILLSDRIALMAARPGRIIEDIAVDLPRPRSGYDVHAHPRFLELRRHLSQRLREVVLNDPASDFFARGSTG